MHGTSNGVILINEENYNLTNHGNKDVLCITECRLNRKRKEVETEGVKSRLQMLRQFLLFLM